MYKSTMSQKAPLCGFIITSHADCSHPNLKLFSISTVRVVKYSPGKQNPPAFKKIKNKKGGRRRRRRKGKGRRRGRRKRRKEEEEERKRVRRRRKKAALSVFQKVCGNLLVKSIKTRQ